MVTIGSCLLLNVFNFQIRFYVMNKKQSMGKSVFLEKKGKILKPKIKIKICIY
jgi:hypothetical protein